MKKRTMCLTLLAAALLSTSNLTAQDAHRTLEIKDQFAIKRVGSPTISPDGEWVAYTVSTTNLEKERTRTQIWMVSTSGGDPIPLTMSGESISGPKPGRRGPASHGAGERRRFLRVVAGRVEAGHVHPRPGLHGDFR